SPARSWISRAASVASGCCGAERTRRSAASSVPSGWPSRRASRPWSMSAYGSPGSRRSASSDSERARSGWFSTKKAWKAARATVRGGALASRARPAASSSTAVDEGGTWAHAQSTSTRTGRRRRIRMAFRARSPRSLLGVAGGRRRRARRHGLLVHRALALRGRLGNVLRLGGSGRFGEHHWLGQVRRFPPDLVPHLTEGALAVDATQCGRGWSAEAVSPFGAQVERLADRTLGGGRPDAGLHLSTARDLQLDVGGAAWRTRRTEHRASPLAQSPLERHRLTDTGDDDGNVPAGATEQHQSRLRVAAHAQELLANSGPERGGRCAGGHVG